MTIIQLLGPEKNWFMKKHESKISWHCPFNCPLQYTSGTLGTCVSVLVKPEHVICISKQFSSRMCNVYVPQSIHTEWQSWRKMEQPYSLNLSDLAECVILCTSSLPSPGKVYCRRVNIWVTLVKLRGPILSAQTGHQLSIYCIKELFGRNSPHLASVNSAYKI